MNQRFIVALLFLFGAQSITRAQSLTALSFKPKRGYHSFSPAFAVTGPVSDKDPFKPALTGVPKTLKKLKYHRVTTNQSQFFYQQFLRGKLTQEDLKQRRVSLESNELQKKPMKVATYILSGETSNGERVWMADTDGDLSFNGEALRPLLTYDVNRYTDIADNATTITVQTVEKGRLKNRSLPLAFCLSPEGDYAYYNFPQYWQATTGDQVVLLQFGGFIEPFPIRTQAKLVVVGQPQANRPIQSKDLVSMGDYVTLHKDVYQVDSLILNQPTVIFKPVRDAASIESAQVGFLTPSFSEPDLIHQLNINPKTLRGKYILLDFWATWCGPCLAEFPTLKKLTEKYDSTKFTVIGIVGDSKKEDVRKLLSNQGISWPQVVGNKVVDQYKVGSYPTTYLISPEGRIIDKNISGVDLEKVLDDLLR